jgi:hypothetical protein
VWADRGFVPWSRISSVAWRENPVTLVLLSRVRSLAQQLEVPGGLYGEARKVLLDRIREHDLQMGQPLGLADADQRDRV